MASTEPAPGRGEEVVDLRTESSRTTLNEDGTYRAEVYPGPIHYRDASGAWQPIDNTLVPASRRGFGFENTANAYKLLLPPDLGQGPVRFEAGGHWVEFSLQGGQGPAQVSGNRATFTPSPGMALAYEAVNEGVKETVTFDSLASVSPLAFNVATSPGMTAQESPGGGIDFLAATGDVPFSFQPPFMVDSSGREEGFSPAVSLDLQSGPTGQSVAVVPDAAWLGDPARVWPVTIDPTITLGRNRDCHISGDMGYTQLCGLTTLRIGYTGTHKRRLLLHFQPSSIPAGASIHAADLALYLFNTTGAGGSTTYELHRVTRSWTDGATWFTYDGTNTWTNPGGDFTGFVWDAPTVDSTPGWKHWDAANLVDDWVRDVYPNDGMLIKQTTETVDKVLEFHSGEASDPALQPKLTVTYSEGLGELDHFRFETQDLNDRMHHHVNVANGNGILHATDLVMRGTAGHDLKIERYHNSLTTGAGAFGVGWRLSVGGDVRVEPQANGDVVYQGPSGYRLRFENNGDGTYDTPPGIDGTLMLSGGTYTLEFFDKRKFEFNAAGLLSADVDASGNRISFAYVSGRLDAITDTHGRVVRFTYEAGKVNTITDESYQTAGASDPRVLTYEYDGSGRLWKYFDPDNDPTRVVGAKFTEYTYDASDRLIKVKDPGNKADQQGNVTDIASDGTTRKVKEVKRAVNDSTGTRPTTTFTYDTVNRKTFVDDPRLNRTTYHWDSQGRVTKVIDAKGNERSTKYNSRSNVTEFTDANQVTFTFGYDSTGEDIESVTLPANGPTPGGAATIGYEDSANTHFPTSVFDFQNHSKGTPSADPSYVYTYDSKGRIKSAEDGEDNVYEYFWNDADGTLDKMEDPKENNSAGTGGITDYNYETTGINKGDLKEIIYPSPLGEFRFTHDASSRIKTVEVLKSDGQVLHSATYTYDKLDRAELVTYSPTGGTVDYDYDANGNLNSRNDSGFGNVVFDVDRLNRVIKETPPPPWINVYTYDDAGNLTRFRDDDGGSGIVTYTYDAVNMVDSLTMKDHQNVDRTIQFRYDDPRDTFRTKTIYPNGVTMEMSPDESGRIKRVKVTKNTQVLFDHSYSYIDEGGKDTALVQTDTNNQGGGSVDYDYDGANRLTQADATATGPIDYLYEYDRNSNLTKRTVGGTAITSYGYNKANELCWRVTGTFANPCASPPTGAVTYQYDEAGNLDTSSQGLNIDYNGRDHATSMTPAGGATVTMKYQDADQTLRTDKDIQGGASIDFSNTLLGVSAQKIGGQSTYWVRDNRGVLVAQRTAGSGANNTHYYTFDRLGSVTGLTDPMGSLVDGETYLYDPYGGAIDGPTSVANPWRFASGFLDSETGFYKFGARYYDPGNQRWTQQDPDTGSLQEPLSLNRYLYVKDDPVNAIDPTGRNHTTAGCLALNAISGGATAFGLGLLIWTIGSPPLAPLTLTLSVGSFLVGAAALFAWLALCTAPHPDETGILG